MHYSPGFLRAVERYARGVSPTTPSDVGLEQFHQHESRGTRPLNPDPYYLQLCAGKMGHGATVTSIVESWGVRENNGLGWPGWASLEEEYDPDTLGEIRRAWRKRWATHPS